MTYSNPRLTAEFNDWPIGGNQRGKCIFAVEDGGKKGIRISRTTTNIHGQWCKPKYSTYGGKAAIVDGDDGKTYILHYRPNIDAVHVMRHDFLNAEDGMVFRNYNELMSLIEGAK